MQITSSRKPSAGTRTLCKLLASFLNCDYFNRGKMGMGEVLDQADGSSLMIVGEYHGNPGSISMYDPEGYCVLSLYLSLSASEKPYPRSGQAEPFIVGEGEIASLFSNLFLPDSSENPSYPLKMVISDDRIDFNEDETTLFTLKIRSYRIFDGGTDCS
ncbi:rRNA maturation protein [Methanolobus sp. ZRKC2]|uniref:rRNA maturation protein n=1 Tax=Methanolobus sp. ZRKC2 TaxID=3125783 RepID=UPI00324359F4